MTVNVSVPTINTLPGMPSLLHLSSTQSELGNCNVHYCLTLTFQHQHLLMIKSTPMMIQSQTLSLKNAFFRKNTIFLPPDIAFQVHLLSQMNEHRGNDLDMFNEVIQYIKAHAIHCRYCQESNLYSCSQNTIS